MATDTIALTSVDAPDGAVSAGRAGVVGPLRPGADERFIELDSPAVRLRVLEVGSGEPVLFVHGTVGPGSWPALVRELPGFRCFVLDRPGWGLSSAIDFSKYEYKAVGRGHLARSTRCPRHSTGRTSSAARSATCGRSVWRRDIRLGSAGSSCWAARRWCPRYEVPGIIRLLASPLGALMVRLPDKPERVRSILRQSGHGASLDDGRIPDVFVSWRVALGRETASMRHERDMVRALVSGRRIPTGTHLRRSGARGDPVRRRCTCTAPRIPWARSTSGGAS